MEIGDIILKVKKEGRNFLLYPEAKELLDIWGISTAPSKIAVDQENAIQAARSIGFPVVMKVFSPDVVHKSDRGGVMTDLRTEEEMVGVFDKIMVHFSKVKPTVKIDGVIIEKMLSGVEVIIGVVKDSQFGHVLMFGMGGVFVELLKDTSFRLIPIKPVDAQEMVQEVRGYTLLEGFRGKRGNIESLRDLLLKVSNLVVHYPEIIEMDMNPVFTSPDGSIVADVRIIIDEH